MTFLSSLRMLHGDNLLEPASTERISSPGWYVDSSSGSFGEGLPCSVASVASFPSISSCQAFHNCTMFASSSKSGSMSSCSLSACFWESTKYTCHDRLISIQYCYTYEIINVIKSQQYIYTLLFYNNVFGLRWRRTKLSCVQSYIYLS